MFENADRRTDGGTDAGVTGILIAHLRAFGSGELKRKEKSLEIDRFTGHFRCFFLNISRTNMKTSKVNQRPVFNL